MQKTDLIKASEKPEHIRKHRGNAHVIGSKALKHVSEQNIHDILSRFEQAYALMIDERENPGRQEFCLKTSAPVGTDAVINAEDIKDGRGFRGCPRPWHALCGKGQSSPDQRQRHADDKSGARHLRSLR